MARAAAKRRKAEAGVELRRPTTAGELASTAEIFREYAASLDVDLCFQDFDAELASLPGEYAPPRGHLLLAYVRGELAGCGAMRPFADAEDGNACEMKRLYVRPAYRGTGLGRTLATAIIAEGRALGHRVMRLDTLPSMGAAIGLYRSLGFVPIPAYRFNPVDGALYMEVCL
jgi:ribosomal protein S18 acetylase RimI-like enzyme